MRITSDGRVGIGTTIPRSLMEVRNDNSITYDATDDGGQRDNTATILVTNENGTTNTFSQLVFDTAGTSQSIARIAAIRTGTSTNDLAFVVEGSNVKREALRIRGNGNVGIGTTDPGRSLTVDGGAGTIIAAFQSTGTGCGFGLKDATTSADNTVTIRAIGDDLVSHAGGEERVRITSDGLVGIGTSAPGYALEVLKSSATFNRVAQFNSNSTVSLIAFGGSNGAGEFAPEIGQDNSTLVFNTQNQERMRVDVNGLVGIGTSVPASRLSNSSTLATDGVQSAGSNSLNWQSSNTNAYIAAFENQSTGNGALVKVGDSDPSRKVLHALDGSNNSLLLVRGDGNVGIGTTAPQKKLEVNGTIKATDINFTGLATYADDAAAGTGGLVAGDVYKTSTGELRIKV